ncbi:response regulator transcription factor [Anaerobacillus isosaccharinicus]|uniref:DNA-binding response regulator n=1 Tax=Anaerobacillus isosaccharinicus TaxID=1532552 RepID=A0A1S2MDZ5_9BACI|nr:response regulator transcription factor [Anaerobacillus isosaccharinicus]MBA5585304.1 response regulator transcription factor [Anaerobacillus isosaccharinicus]QOY36369.1 response regulator transcription factor [Anaerobacillus isosaccharinicus]
MEKYIINLVEDEKNLAEILKAYMIREGWDVHHFADGQEAYDAISHATPHLWILDIMLPNMDGYQLLKAIKAKNDTPVIFISARDKDLDRVLGLELGSDDYLAKPFLPEELIIRVKRILSRAYTQSVQQEEQKRIELNGYFIDPATRNIYDGNELLEMTTKELDVIILLTSKIGKAFSREEIIDYVWGSDYYGSERAVDDVVRRVRKKLPRLHVETLYGFGYRVLSS